MKPNLDVPTPLVRSINFLLVACYIWTSRHRLRCNMPGYEIPDQNRKNVSSKHICQSCNFLLRDPVQTSCGHRYCRSCIDNLKTRTGYLFSSCNFRCIVDGKDVAESVIFPDKFIKREVLSLQVNCLWQQKGYQWRGELRDFERHNSSCTRQQVTCVHDECGMVMAKSQLVGHLETECTFRLVSCEHCNQQVCFSSMLLHLQTDCEGFPVNCRHCQKPGIPRGKMADHLDALQGDCEVVEVCCPYTAVGCPNNQKVRRPELIEHLNNSIQEHLGFVLLTVRHFADKIAETAAVDGGSRPEYNRDAASAFRAVDQICQEINRSRHCSNQVNRDMEGVLERLRELELKWEGLRSISDSVPRSLDPPSLRPTRLINANDLRLLCEETATSCRNLHGMLRQLHLSTAASVDEIRSSVVQHERRLDRQDRKIAELNTSYNGELIFKVTDARRWTRVEEHDGNAPVVTSPCFYTSQHGYKMAVKLCLNNSSGSRPHISLFLVIMRGNFDAVLRWPFKQKVTMMLLDQDNTNHKTRNFTPDTNSASFQRPTDEMNIAAGFPTFCLLSELESHAYIRDDTMFIKVIVDTLDL